MNFRTLNTAAITIGLGAALLGSTVGAKARDYSGDLLCTLTDRRGNELLYGFANNSHNADGSLGGTFVETGFVKNRSSTTAPTGMRPVWLFAANTYGGLTMISRDAPGWSIVEGPIARKGLVYVAPAVLSDNGTTKARGYCTRRTAPTGADIGDVAGE